MIAVFKREFKAYFNTVIGWLFIAVTLFFISLYYMVYNLYYGYPFVSYVFQSVLFLFFISVPVLTMRILAEDRKNKTDQMIYTTPVSIGKVVLGKLLAMIAVFAIPVAFSCIYPIILLNYGKVSLSEAYTPIIGYFLYGAACIAIGMFISSITESQVIAAVLSVLVLFLGYMMSSLCGVISADGNLITKVLSIFSMTERYDSMAQGIMDLSSVVYFLTIIFLFIFLTIQSIQKRRWSFNKKNVKVGVFSTGFVVVVIAIAVVVNVAFNKLPDSFTKIDITSEKFYSIGDDTKKILNNLDQDITIYVLASESGQDETVQKTLNRYASYKHVKVEYKDPTKYPNFANKYTTTSLTKNSVIVVCGDKSKAIDYNNLYVVETSMDYTTYSQNQTATGYDAEGQITSAISFVTSDDNPVVYVITGHDEVALSDSFQNALDKENIDTQELSLLTVNKIPSDAECLLILGPTSDFNENETDMVLDYLHNGGNAYILTAYTDKKMTNFSKILNDYGIKVNEGVVLDNDRNSYTQYPYLMIPTVKSTEVTQNAADEYVMVAYGQGFTLSDNHRSGITLNTLLETSDSAVSKTDIQTMQSYEYEDGDIKGPFTLGVWATEYANDYKAASGTDATEVDASSTDAGNTTASGTDASNAASGNSDGTTNVVAFSSDYMVDDQIDQVVSGHNLLLFQSVMSALVDHEVTISIPAKNYETSGLTVPNSDMIFLAIILVAIIPIGLVTVGIIIWVKRRKR